MGTPFKMNSRKILKQHEFYFASGEIVKRIEDVTFSPLNLRRADDAADYWISGEAGLANIKLDLDRFYHVR